MRFEPRMSRSRPEMGIRPRRKRVSRVIIAFAVLASAGWVFARDFNCIEEHALVLADDNPEVGPLSDALTFAPWLSLESESRIKISLRIGESSDWQMALVRSE